MFAVKDVLTPTATDQAVFEYAAEHDILLVTCNRDDFVPLATESAHAGLIVLVRRRSRIEECAAVVRLLNKAGSNGLRNNINFA